MKLLSLFAAIACAALFGSDVLAGQEQGSVFVSILPQKYFVQQISKDVVIVEVMVPPGASPVTYEPKSSQMRKLADSSAYFAIGVPFEHAWLDRIAGVNPKMKIVRTDGGIGKLNMSEHHHDHGDHESELAHEGDRHRDGPGIAGQHDDGLDPHIWLSPSLVKKQLHAIAAVLIEMYPQEHVFFEKNLQEFLGKIDELDHKLKLILADKQGTKFMVFHPSWGYFAHDYGLEQVAIEIEGKSPKPAQLKELIMYARGNNISVLFAQPQFSTKSAEIVAREIEGEVILIDPLAENWFENMVRVAEKLKQALR